MWRGWTIGTCREQRLKLVLDSGTSEQTKTLCWHFDVGSVAVKNYLSRGLADFRIDLPGWFLVRRGQSGIRLFETLPGYANAYFYALFIFPMRFYQFSMRNYAFTRLICSSGEILSQSKMVNKELWTGQQFWLCVQCDLDLQGTDLGRGHDTPLGHGQQLCKKLSRPGQTLQFYSADMDICDFDLRVIT